MSRRAVWRVTAGFWAVGAVISIFATDGLAAPAACMAASQTALLLGGYGVRP